MNSLDKLQMLHVNKCLQWRMQRLVGVLRDAVGRVELIWSASLTSELVALAL